MDYATVYDRVGEVASGFAQQRSERQRRRQLDRQDWDALAGTGFPLLGLPADEEHRGLWKSVVDTTRPACELLRLLATGDSSVALVSAMHPAVLSYWLTAPSELQSEPLWQRQCTDIFQSVKGGHWWGTITSEPGTGGDITKSRAVATPTGDGELSFHLTGQKHFGSGTGITSFIVTTAVPEGERSADWFFVDMRPFEQKSSPQMRIFAEWDGHGMTATQSHGIQFERCPATRMAWTDNLLSVASRAGGFIGCLFTSVIVGIIDVAVATAQEKFDSQQPGAYETSEWTRVRMEYWLIQQAYEGMLRAVETKLDPRADVLLGKTNISELAETLMTRLCRVMGGSTFARHSPFGFWFEDVRALGFLRPPWGLAFQTLAKMRTV